MVKLIKVAFVFGICLTGATLGQTKREIVDYMRENGVGYLLAVQQLGYDRHDAAVALGYNSWTSAMMGMNLAFLDCIEPLVWVRGSLEDLGVS